MKAMLFVSIAALFDAAPIERKALEITFAQISAPIPWSMADHEHLLQKGSVLQALAQMTPFASAQNVANVYLDTLNELLWEAPASPQSETRKAIAMATTQGLRRGLVSDYPLVTTNLARAAALETVASTIGDICALRDPQKPTSTDVGLLHLSDQLNVRPADCIAVVTHERDRHAARTLGMTPFMIRNPGNWHGSTCMYRSARCLNAIKDLAKLVQPPRATRHLAA